METAPAIITQHVLKERQTSDEIEELAENSETVEDRSVPGGVDAPFGQANKPPPTPLLL
jgi:hypothetical protein